MDNEGFYDSLDDEEFSSASSTSVACAEPNPELKVPSKCALTSTTDSSSANPNLNHTKLSCNETNPESTRTQDVSPTNQLDIIEMDFHGWMDVCTRSTVLTEPEPSNIEEEDVLTTVFSNTKLLMVREGSDFALEKVFEAQCKVGDKEERDISSMVPLYDGDMSKTDILGPSKKCSSIPLLNKKKSQCGVAVRKLRSKGDIRCTRQNSNTSFKRRYKLNNIDAVVQHNPSPSYLSLFHARIGYPEGGTKKKIEDTTRCTFGDSQRSVLSGLSTDRDHFSDAQDNDSDDSSFYFNEMQKAFNKSNSDYDSNNSSTSMQSSLPPTKYNSVSELSVLSSQGEAGSKKKLRSRKTRLVSVPVLGGLGPDTVACQEKLERRKRQLHYGQRASIKNRIKMVEINILKNLKEEIYMSNLVDKEQKAFKSTK